MYTAKRDVDNRTLGVEPADFRCAPPRSGACGSNDTLGARAVAPFAGRSEFTSIGAKRADLQTLWRNNRFFVHSSNSKGSPGEPGHGGLCV